MYLLWMALSVLSVLAGFNFLTQATLGVGVVLIGVWFAVLARIVQAKTHHDALRAVLLDLEREAVKARLKQ